MRARHVRPLLGMGAGLPPALSAPSVGQRGRGALCVRGLSGPAVRLRWVPARRLSVWSRAPDSEGVGTSGEPFRPAADAAPVLPSREALGPSHLPGWRPRAGGGERSGGWGRGQLAGEVRRGAEGGGHRV